MLGRTLQIQTPRAFLPLLRPSRYKGAYGGRGSGKSHQFAEMLIEKCILRSTRFVCVREVQRSLEQSVKRLLEDKIKDMGVGSQFDVMDAVIKAPNDGLIIFQGMQNHTAESIKSLEGYDGAWVEEAQSLSETSLTLLRPTIRKEDSELWFSWNPRHATDPVDDLLRGNAPRKEGQPPWTPPPDSTVVATNFTDNPWFPDVLRREMGWDRSVDVEKYQHVWGGGYEKHSEARVFKNWRIEAFETPADVFFLLGGDWGFSVDPTVLIRCFQVIPPDTTNGVAPPRKRLYIDQEVYKIGCEIDHTPALFDTMDMGKMRNWPIVADSARPETISYLRRHGYTGIEPAIKGPNSVKEGVIFLQGFDIIIHPRCVHTIDEFTHYSYRRDPVTNLVMPILEDKKNHVIDSVRYAAERLRGGVRVRQNQWG